MVAYISALPGWHGIISGRSVDYHLKLIRLEYTKDNLTHTVALKSEAPVHTFDEKSLHQQFIANAGLPYLTVTLSSGDKYQPTGKRDSYFLVEDIREKLKGD